MPLQVSKEKREFARQMRQHPTPAERQLWYHLRRSALGYKFLNQAHLAGYIVDFYCPSARVVIEIDGSVHLLFTVAANDDEKERNLESRGLSVLRFQNEEVLEFPTVVIARIRTICDERRAARATLKALSGAVAVDSLSGIAVAVDTCARSEWPANLQAQLKKTVSAVCAQPVHEPMTDEDIKAVNDGWAKLRRGTRMTAYQPMTQMETANDQKLRLQEWLRKRAESAALTVKGMHVTDFRRQA